MTTLALMLAAALLTDGDVLIEGEKQIDVARSMTLKVSPRGIDLRERFRGFSVADDYESEEENCTYWLLTPKPCEKVYKLAPFAYEGRVIGPIYFDPPSARETVTGGMEVDPRRDLPPLSWKLAGKLALWTLGGLLVLVLVVLLLRFALRRVKEHKLSPIERAWVELDRLLKKGLPGRGRYKDFYVELTMVVRRYIQRKYGIKAPHLTTEEFLREIGRGASSALGPVTNSESLRKFLESADMVKFAGVEATPEMADGATDTARGYLKSDNKVTPSAH